jgi:hypothetical protein
MERDFVMSAKITRKVNFASDAKLEVMVMLHPVDVFRAIVMIMVMRVVVYVIKRVVNVFVLTTPKARIAKIVSTAFMVILAMEVAVICSVNHEEYLK